MVIAGLCGGLDRASENRFGVSHYSFHDAACALVQDGEVTAASEEERLNRIKHTNKCPLFALRFCLESRGLDIADVDQFAFGVRESYLDEVIAHRYARARSLGVHLARRYLQQLFEEEFDWGPDPRRFHFVDHHFAHACSAYYPSGFDRALIFTVDGVGDGLSGSLYVGTPDGLEPLRTFAEEDSLGFFYLHVTRYLGFDLFDEYKVMGLAPYGDGARFAPLFDRLYELLPDGGYRLNRAPLRRLWSRLPPRHAGANPTQSDKDVAMAAQLALQRIVGHVLEHHRRTTGLQDLCLAGGVALNCSMNGELLRRGLFRRIFAQPAAHDAGLSLGAALHVHHRSQPRALPARPMRHVYWGGRCGSPAEIEAVLENWGRFVAAERVDDPCAAAATLLSEGTIVGWVQGRSEFGPRALGNRSILADPRPSVHKDVINALVKKREAFRPFAPSVLEEYAAEFFELPGEQHAFPFMLFTCPVRPQYREVLGAITHVDGSARLQTVARADNPCYWRLIDCFRELTGVPVLLNTSFNSFAEPIVQTASDSLVCFLTTGLPVLVLENWIVTKRPLTPDALLSLKLRLPVHAKLHDGSAERSQGAHHAPPAPWWRRLRSGISAIWVRGSDKRVPAAVIGNTFNDREYLVPEDVFRILLVCDGYRTLAELMESASVIDEPARTTCVRAIEELWERRLVLLSP